MTNALVLITLASLPSDFNWPTVVEKAISTYESTMLNEGARVSRHVARLQAKAQAAGNLQLAESLDDELNAFVVDGSLPDGPVKKRVDTVRKKARMRLLRAVESAIRKERKSEDQTLTERLTKLKQQIGEGELDPQQPYFYAGDMFDGTRLRWDNTHAAFRVVIQQIDGNAFKGYILRPGKKGINPVPIHGTISDRKIDFRSKGVPGQRLALVDLHYRGKLEAGQLSLTFDGKSATGDPRHGSALVTKSGVAAR